ncbi:MAG TPA: PHB depolymerase family esterase [Caldimonas sp.]|nr:PHB depolymerase family esterase [Caldimonas sp.]
MKRRRAASSWPALVHRNLAALTRVGLGAGSLSVSRALAPLRAARQAPAGAGDWLAGLAFGPTGVQRYRLFRPAGVPFGERPPLMVMLHGCGQDAKTFAASTRMNVVAARERFLVLYPEQDRVSNANGCWNWFDTRTGRAGSEAALIMAAIGQVCLLHAADRDRVAIAGLSAGASMAALLVARHPERFKAVTMHSGVAPGAAHSTLSAVGAMQGRRSPPSLPAAANAAAWPPLLVIQGEGDAVVSVRNGRAAAQAWADASGALAGAARAVRRGKRYPMTVTDFKAQGVTKATLVQVGRLGHAWSGGARDERFSDGQGPDASRMAWGFASKQFGDRA